ncbi:uncharacterized protein B0T23DRAFT_382871 [Neurospora hispaniola]|uniref:Uncharacterized protein n=1 Tax=Neurospora hispaniola TaxID=588809 RepID=A0AAJ0I6C5_9PEZI|nr:hypothetical protein B0T23DRAFT_382871 [Neurospora hispaniola]
MQMQSALQRSPPPDLTQPHSTLAELPERDLLCEFGEQGSCHVHYLPAAKKEEKSGGGKVAPTCLSARLWCSRFPNFTFYPRHSACPRSFSIRLFKAFQRPQALPPDATDCPKIETARFRRTSSAAADHHLSLFCRPDELTYDGDAHHWAWVAVMAERKRDSSHLQ